MTEYSLQQLVPSAVFPAALVFSRIGTTFSLLPGFGEAYVPVRIRLVAALGVALLVTPLIAPQLPAEPSSPLRLFVLLFGEIFIGLFLGLASRVLLAALETGGAIIAMQSSLASALVFNPGAAQPQTLPSGLFGVLSIVLIFATGTYSFLLKALVDSYAAFPAGALPPFDDMSKAMVHLASRSFEISVELAAPFLIVGTLFYILLGLIGRIMPQLQVFYIALPVQLIGGLALLALLASTSMLWFLGVFRDSFSALSQAS